MKTSSCLQNRVNIQTNITIALKEPNGKEYESKTIYSIHEYVPNSDLLLSYIYHLYVGDDKVEYYEIKTIGDHIYKIYKNLKGFYIIKDI